MPSDKSLLAELLELSPAERIQLAEDLWDSVVASPETMPSLTATQIAEIERRRAEHARGPSYAYEDFGTIEGRLHVISDQGAPHVFITEPVKQHHVHCDFDESMLPLFLAAFGKRVEVSGRIKYRSDHTPISIHANALTEFPDKEDLPSYREMRGIFRAKRA